METRTQLNGLRLAPRKVRAVVDLIRRKDVSVALDQLEHLIKKPSPIVLKLLKTAVANAEHNFQMVADNLYIKSIFVNEGEKLKRFMPRAQGRATEIQKKTSRVVVILDERVAGLKRSAPVRAKQEVAAVDGAAVAEEKGSSKPAAKAPIKKELGKKGNMLGNLGKKMFQRKSV